MKFKIFFCVALFTIAVGGKDDSSFTLNLGGISDLWSKWKDVWTDKEWDTDRRNEGQQKMRYLLRDREEQTWKEIPKNGSVPSCWVDDGEVKLLLHGYSANLKTEDPMKIIRNQNIFDIGLIYGTKNKSLNIIIVDWTALSVDTMDKYPEIVKNVPYAADNVVEFLKNLTKAEKVKDTKLVHIIGLGVGAHVAGVIGHKIQTEMDNKTIARITGLDPSGTEFDDDVGKSYKNDSLALDKTDADFVDIIHCNMGKSKTFTEASIKGRFGSTVQAGVIDFYPNGGETQKDCPGTDETTEKACSQRKCALHYSDSIVKKLVACPCDDWEFYKSGKCNCTETDGGVLMGDPCHLGSAKGRYYIAIPQEKEGKSGEDKHKE